MSSSRKNFRRRADDDEVTNASTKTQTLTVPKSKSQLARIDGLQRRTVADVDALSQEMAREVQEGRGVPTRLTCGVPFLQITGARTGGDFPGGGYFLAMGAASVRARSGTGCRAHAEAPSFGKQISNKHLVRLPMVPFLLLVLLLVAPGGLSSSSSDDHCPDDLFDHSLDSKGAIKFPVFHRNHLCLHSLVRPSSGEMMHQMDTSIDIIEDRSLNSLVFLMPVKLGTPTIMNLVAIDTGSTFPWVQCQPCTISCHEQPVQAGPIFEPNKSSTFQRVSCSSNDCAQIKDALKLQSANCMEKEDSCLYSISYGLESAYSVGKVVRDKLTIGNNDTSINLMFGCSLDVNYWAMEAGVFGFGSTYLSFIEQMVPLIGYKAFRYCFPSEETGKGYMSLGDYNRQGVDGYTPLFGSKNKPTYSLIMTTFTIGGQNIVNSNTEMLVDTGSPLTYLSTETFNSLVENMEQAMKQLGYFRNNPRRDTSLCFVSESDWNNWNGTYTPFTDWSHLPVLEIGFAGTAKLTLPPKNAFYNDPKYGFCSTFTYGSFNGQQIQILGNKVIRSFETIFDIQGQKFGFRHGAC